MRFPPQVKKTLLHLAAWSALLSVAYLFFYSGAPANAHGMGPDWRLQLHFIVTIIVLAGLFYFCSAVLVPKFLYTHRILLFLLITGLLGTGFVMGINAYFKLVSTHAQPPAFANDPNSPQPTPGVPPPMPGPGGPNGQPPPGPPNERTLPLTVTLLPFLLTIGAGVAYRYINDAGKNEKRMRELELSAVRSELLFLRSQISPHFLFNVMNSLTFLARSQSTMLEPSLQKLSSLLRYMLYDTNTEAVLLDQEIRYLEDYIGLQQIRHQDLPITVIMLNEDERLTIAPMLLIPFVENAFKHVSGYVDASNYIRIELVARADRKLQFKVTNNYTDHGLEQKDSASGIGLANVRKRLQLLYPQAHELLISRQAGTFTASLRIDL